MTRYLQGLTPAQWFGIVLAILGVLGASVTQLTDLFGPTMAKTIVTASNLLMTIMSALLVPLTGQSAQIKAVDAMPGVEKVLVNEKANSTLAAIAMDPSTKVEATQASAETVAATAKEGT